MFRCPLVCLCLLVIFTGTFLSSCVFKSEDEYFNKLVIPDPTAVGGTIHSVDLANYNPGDTIDLFGTTSFNFSLSGTHGNIESATVSLGTGDSWRKVSTGTTNSFMLSMGQLNYYRLKGR